MLIRDLLKQAFADTHGDGKKDGYVTRGELEGLLRKFVKSLSKEQVALVLDNLDPKKAGKVNCNELVDFLYQPGDSDYNEAESTKEAEARKKKEEDAVLKIQAYLKGEQERAQVASKRDEKRQQQAAQAPPPAAGTPPAAAPAAAKGQKEAFEEKAGPQPVTLKADSKAGPLGLTFKGKRPEPAVVEKVAPKSWGEANSVKPGYEVISVNNVAIRDIKDEATFQKALEKRPVTLLLRPAGSQISAEEAIKREQATKKIQEANKKKEPAPAAAAVAPAAAKAQDKKEAFEDTAGPQPMTLQAPSAGSLGLTFKGGSAAALVDKVAPKSWAEANNIKPGYEVVSVNGMAVTKMKDQATFHKELDKRPMTMLVLPVGCKVSAEEAMAREAATKKIQDANKAKAAGEGRQEHLRQVEREKAQQLDGALSKGKQDAAKPNDGAAEAAARQREKEAREKKEREKEAAKLDKLYGAKGVAGGKPAATSTKK